MPITRNQAAKLFGAKYDADPEYRPFTADDRKRLDGRLPEIVLGLAAKHGWCSFGRQQLWLCDPDDWKGVAKPWLPSGRGDLILRTAFGEMVAMAGKKFWLVLPHSATRVRLSDDPNWVLGVTLADAGYDDLASLAKAVPAARQKAGKLDWRQMYNFAPAIALGGSRENSRIATEDMKVALSILHQLTPITALDD